MHEKRTAKSSIIKMRDIGKFRSDTDLGEFLGVSKITVASWRKRNSIPLEKLILFAQKTMTSLDVLVFEEGANLNFAQENSDSTAFSVAIYFYKKASENFLFGDVWQTSLWWGRVFNSLVNYYSYEIFSVAEKEDMHFEEAAIEIMKVIDDLDPKDMTKLLKEKIKGSVDFI